jgi:hypothetical protein
LGDLLVDRRIILNWILKKQDLRMWTGVTWLRICTNGGALVNTEMNQGGSIKRWEFLEQPGY